MNDAAKAIKEAPTDVLCKAAKTLQEAHDYVERHEFGMGYGHLEGAGSCCFIGSVRQAAAEHTIGPDGPSTHPASELALWALDKAVARSYRGETVLRDSAGGVAETTIVRTNNGGPRKTNLKKPQALATYRQAIRELQTELVGRADLAKAEKRVSKKREKLLV